MKKNLFLAALAFVAMASCTSDEFVGENTSPNSGNNNGNGAISFNSGSKAITRAKEGAEAARLLNNNFVVEGIKTINSTPSEVFDNYNVNYLENTADKTASNTANWEYVAQTILTGKTAAAEQTIKYWDFAAKQYDFWAYSLGGGSATVSSLAHDATLTSSAYTISGDATNLAKVYISDLVTAYNPEKTVSGVANDKTEPAVMGNEVTLSFRSLVSKVRVGLYETIPGYSVREVKFYPSGAANETPTTTATLYASSAELPAFNGSTNEAEFTVKFPTIGVNNIGNSDYNKAHVALSSSDHASTVEFGTLSYGAHEGGKKEKTGYTEGTGTWTEIWLQRTANTCTWAGSSTGDYSIVLPYETGAVLTLKLDYTLESIDGTGETIEVHGATALVPAEYTQWKANYAYTYLFKISDNTNGWTNLTNADKVGLYPITLDAIVVGNEEGTQETITTVATPSITTYSITSNVTTNNEYTTSDDIYVVAMENGNLITLTGKADLYDITDGTDPIDATEAEVLAALNTYSTKTGASAPYTYTGRNSVVLTPVADALVLTGTTIPTVDGQTVDITPGQAAFIDHTANKLTAGHNYAFVYQKTAGDTPVAHYEAVTVAAGGAVTGLYTTNDGTDIAASVDNDNQQTLYAKYFTVANAVYGIKVIKVN